MRIIKSARKVNRCVIIAFAMKIIYDEKICVRCLACAKEAEFGGVTYERGKIFFDETKPEDWQNIAAICPVGAINTESTVACAARRADSINPNFDF